MLERIIKYQNESERNFESAKNTGTILNYLLAFIPFIFSTIIAALTFPIGYINNKITQNNNVSKIIRLDEKNFDIILNKGKITQFALENWWVTNMESYKKETSSNSYLQAIEETTLLIISKDELEKLFILVPKLERLFRIITENILIVIQRRNDIYLQIKSKDRYFDLTQHFPEFSQRVPQYMIASYLEITPEYLSELRRN